MIIRNKFVILLAWIFALPNFLSAQKDQTGDNYTAYELMSKYYNEDFHPFKKHNKYIGLSFSLADLQQENTTGLLQNVVDGQRLRYNIMAKGGYYISDYTMLGINFLYNYNKFEGLVFRDPDTLQSNSLTRSYDLTPSIRPSIPLTRNERLSFFIELGLTFGYLSELERNTKNLDEITKKYTEGFHFRAGISPGITFFAIESFAFEVQLNVIGYDLQVTQQTVNEGPESREIEQHIDARIDLLSLNLGLAYYFGSKR